MMQTLVFGAARSRPRRAAAWAAVALVWAWGTSSAWAQAPGGDGNDGADGANGAESILLPDLAAVAQPFSYDEVAASAPARPEAEPPAPRFRYLDGGNEVIDGQTGLIWRRCTEGMHWNGISCAGLPNTYRQDAALAYAQCQPGWRLPSAQELASLIHPALTAPAIDSATFPATPANWFWSWSTYGLYTGSAWGISFSDGQARSHYIHHSYPIRLVRRVWPDSGPGVPPTPPHSKTPTS